MTAEPLPTFDQRKEARASVALDGDTVVIEPPLDGPELTADDVFRRLRQEGTTVETRMGVLERYVQQRVKAACDAVWGNAEQVLRGCPGNLPRIEIVRATLDAVERSVKGG